MIKHTNDTPTCASCEEKMQQLNSDHAAWFREKVKPKFQDAHISCTYRNEADQNMAVATMKSKLKYPLSAHNKCDDQGNPCALAFDLFRLCSNGMAAWEWKFFKEISDQAKLDGYPLKWGGDFKTLGDSDHFERGIS